MKLSRSSADVFVPDGRPLEDALSSVTHLAVGAHSDDLEIMAFHGIVECYYSTTKGFAGVTCTDGGGCVREGRYASHSREEMVETRRIEQRSAAILGSYRAMLQLDHSSSVLREDISPLSSDLEEILGRTRPRIIYTHNPADKHDSHVTVFLALLDALRRLAPDYRPRELLGCEGWRGLDWLPDSRKVVLDVGDHDHLAQSLLGCFDSQIASGKRYDVAAIGRRAANATFLDPLHSDDTEQATFAMDLMPLLDHPDLSPFDFVSSLLDELRGEIREKLARKG